MKQKGILSSILPIVFALSIHAAVNDWQTFTSMNDIRDVSINGNMLWCATNGGALKFNLIDKTFEKITNTEGLTSNSVNVIAVDPDGRVWIGLSDGIINIFDNAENFWHTVKVLEQFPIYDFYFSGDCIYVAISKGVGVLKYSEESRSYEVKDTYLKLGEFQSEIPANCILIDSDHILVGTDQGVAKGVLDPLINLQEPGNWSNYHIYNDPEKDKISDIILWDTTLFAATEKDGIAKLQDNNWVISNPWLDVTELAVDDGTLYAATADGVYRLTDLSTDSWTLLDSALSKVSSLDFDGEGSPWVGRMNQKYKVGGISGWLNQHWENFFPNTPAGNSITDLAIDLDGNLWCAGADVIGKGFYGFDGEHWTNYSLQNQTSRYFEEISIAVMVDRNNAKWFGSWGRGICVLDSDRSLSFFDSHDSTGAHLQGDKEEDGTNPDYVIVTDVVEDKDGNIWILNRLAINDSVMVVMTPDSNWFYFRDSALNPGSPFSHSCVTQLVIDQYGRKWMGTYYVVDGGAGVRVFDDNGTLADKGDDIWFGFKTGDGLETDDVKSLAIDLDGTIWVGTTEGVNYIHNSPNWEDIQVVGSLWGLIDNVINCIAVDARNNKWFGTNNGISVLKSGEVYPSIYYTKDNSPLVGNHINAITFNHRTGGAWIGTDQGLSRLQTPYLELGRTLGKVDVFPNPFIVDGSRRMKFETTTLAEGFSVKILTPNGLLVRRLNQDEALAGWDGKNEREQLVASGIYLVLVYTADGQSAVGKIAVIRP